MAAKWQRKKINIPDDFGPADRELIAADIIEHIRLRTESGRNKKNRPFPKYSKEYIESLDFKIAGKKPGKVDLTLTGDMLIALDLISHKKGELLIGYENGTIENAKADGNIRGTYGNPSPIPGKARDFLGITKKKLGEIVRSYRE